MTSPSKKTFILRNSFPQQHFLFFRSSMDANIVKYGPLCRQTHGTKQVYRCN